MNRRTNEKWMNEKMFNEQKEKKKNECLMNKRKEKNG